MQAFLDSYKIIDSFSDPKIQGVKIQHVTDVEKDIFWNLVKITAPIPAYPSVLTWENYAKTKSVVG
jgi:hypothetical protein